MYQAKDCLTYMDSRLKTKNMTFFQKNLSTGFLVQRKSVTAKNGIDMFTQQRFMVCVQMFNSVVFVKSSYLGLYLKEFIKNNVTLILLSNQSYKRVKLPLIGRIFQNYPENYPKAIKILWFLTSIKHCQLRKRQKKIFNILSKSFTQKPFDQT